ncbi:MAG: sensor histidine kinase [Christensenellales bacterium]
MFNLGINKMLQNYLASANQKNGYEGAIEARTLANSTIGIDVITKKTAGVYIYAEKQHAYPTYTSSNIDITSGHSATEGVFRATSIRGEPWYTEASQNLGQISWRPPEWDNVRQKTEFSATRAILNTKNLRESLGIIRVFVSTEYIQNILNKVRLGKEGEVYLYCGETLLNYEDAESLPDLLTLVQNDEGGLKSVTIDGKPYYVIIRNAGISDWMLLGIVPKSNVNYTFDLLRNITIAIIVLGLLATMLISHLIARSVSRPIQNVAHAMEHYDYHKKTRFDEQRNDEVGVLFKGYNRLMDEITRLLCEIKKSADNQRKAELHALQAQINPHFLYNTLNCISSLAYAKNTPEIADLTLALSEFFRISLNKGSEELPLRREIEHVKSYCAIQKYRSANPFTLKVNIPEELLDVQVIKLILQPLVENAIIHGFVKGSRVGKIVISAEKKGQYLFLRIRDNGEGADVEYLNGILSGEYKSSPNQLLSSGYGILNVHERIKLAFGEQSALYYTENEGEAGITAVIRIHMKGEHTGEQTNKTD